MRPLKVLIVEDEPVAANALRRNLSSLYPTNLEVIAQTGSVAQTLEFLNTRGGELDIIFMDVELSDGDCFEIFRRCTITASVVMTTAYDNYAVKAFEVNSIDYLLKPIDPEGLKRAVERCREKACKANFSGLLSSFTREESRYKQRFIVKVGDRIVPVDVEEIDYFFSEDKMTWLVTSEGRRYIMDSSLDSISDMLDPDKFFRISRSCTLASKAIRSIVKVPGGRLKVIPKDPKTELLVSRSRVDDFMDWLSK